MRLAIDMSVVIRSCKNTQVKQASNYDEECHQFFSHRLPEIGAKRKKKQPKEKRKKETKQIKQTKNKQERRIKVPSIIRKK